MGFVIPLTVTFISFVLFLLFFLVDCSFAWGPGMHSFITMSIPLAKISSSIAQLCGKYYHNFVWGSLMADMIIGKNLSNWDYHPHNWQVILRIFYKAKEDFLKAFMIGYMVHLAQDIIAHNFMVPDFILFSAFSPRLRGGISLLHLKVEAEAEKFVPRETWEKISELKSLPDNKLCERFLEENLKGTIISSARANGKIYEKALTLNIIKESIRSKIIKFLRTDNLLSFIISEYADMARKTSEEFIKNFERSKLLDFDPTGIESIYISYSLKKSVEKIRKRKNGNGVEPAKFFRVLREFQPPIFGNRIPVLFMLKKSL
ncbi:hypothetical protein HRbin19_00815 [bacterium HR19]|nr:hypothetical protein HRbin19_00815 [bacterium HR19]